MVLEAESVCPPPEIMGLVEEEVANAYMGLNYHYAHECLKSARKFRNGDNETFLHLAQVFREQARVWRRYLLKHYGKRKV